MSYIFLLYKTGFDQSKASLHKHHEETAYQSSHNVDRNLVMATLAATSSAVGLPAVAAVTSAAVPVLVPLASWENALMEQNKNTAMHKLFNKGLNLKLNMVYV